MHRGDGERHQERRHQQDERRERRQLDGEQVLDETLVAFRVGEAGGEELAVQQVGRDQRAEEHAVRSQEEPHDELLVVDSGGSRRVMRVSSLRHKFRLRKLGERAKSVGGGRGRRSRLT